MTLPLGSSYLYDPLPRGAVLQCELRDDLAALAWGVVGVQPRRDTQPPQETGVTLHHLKINVTVQ